jgi:superfamily II DNA or RNA helicase
VLELIYKNDCITVSGEYTKDILSMIIEECSYTVPSAEWSMKYQTGVWDGKISLYNKRLNSFPSGLLSDVSKMLDTIKTPYKISDFRNKPEISNNFSLNLIDRNFRDYQLEAIQKIKKNHRGILAMCTGAGKTLTACGMITELSSYPVIFIVPSVSLLKQTVKEFKQTLVHNNSNVGIGEIGGGECIIFENGVNVCTYQTLLTSYDKKYSETKKKIIDLDEDSTSIQSLKKQLLNLQIDLQHSPPNQHKAINKKISEINKKIEHKNKIIEDKKQIRNLIERCQLLISDETHIASETIEFLSQKSFSAYYKCGLSATPFRTDNQDKRMFGATGPIIHKVSASLLIEMGYLVKPYIYGIDLDMIDKSSITYQETYKTGIVQNNERNELISNLATAMHNETRPTLILVERLEHGKYLESIIPNSLFVPGGDSTDDKPISEEEMDYRRYQLNRLENNEIIMIATQWANTGIDAPKISCLILAGSSSSDVVTFQQIGRALRKAPGKTDCVIFDFKHKEKHLKKHFYFRQKVYQSEPQFEYKLIKYNTSKGLYVQI